MILFVDFFLELYRHSIDTHIKQWIHEYKSQINKTKTNKNEILIINLWTKVYQLQFHATIFQATRPNTLYLLTFYLRVHRIGEYVSDWSSHSLVCCANKFPSDEIVFGMWRTCAQWRMYEIRIDLLLSIFMTFWTNFTFSKPHLTVWTKHMMQCYVNGWTDK